MMYLLIMVPIEIGLVVLARYRQEKVREAVQKAVEKALDLDL